MPGPYPQMIEAGAVALPPGQSAAFLIAPRGAAIGRLIAAIGRRGPAANIALTTPSHLSWLVRKATRREIGRTASLGLPDFDANLCARGGMNARQGMALGVLGSVAAFFLPVAPAASVTTAATLLGIALLATFWLRLSACAASPQPRPPPSRALNDDELPLYSIVIALYREARVVPQLLDAIDALAYPRAKLDVKLVLEQCDRETLEALKRLGVPPFREVIVAPPGMPRTKPRALNVALPLLRGKFVAVYDAEDIPDPQQLRLAASRFAETPARLACLQAQLAIDNIGDGWLPNGLMAQTPGVCAIRPLPKLFAIEYSALFDVINTGLSALRIPFSLGGTSNHFRADVLRRIGGWDAWNVTEDADIGFRLARFGYESETLKSTTYEEAPISFGAFFRQRRRWCKGWYQTLIVLWRQPRRLLQQTGLARSGALTLVLLANILGSLTAPLCAICLGADVLLGAKALPTNAWEDVLAALWTTVIVAGVPAVFWPALKGMKRRGLLSIWPVLFLLPAYSLIICAAAWTALYDLARRPHHWLKTEHGRARRGVRGGVIRRRLVEPLVPAAGD